MTEEPDLFRPVPGKYSLKMTTGNTREWRVEYNAAIHPVEQAGYFPVSDAHLYTVLHGTVNPQARVLLVGSFASERHLSYIPWVRWARYLAARGVECLRYDHRGIGESTGVFEQLSFENWQEDVEALAIWLKGQSPDLPLVLHGLEVGALMAAKAFERGIGDGLLLWGPPATANQALRATLTRRIALDNAFKYGDERKPLSDYVQRLENGEFIDVDGYRWSGRLWRDSLDLQLPPGTGEAGSDAALAHGRPTRMLKPDKLKAPLIKGSSVGYEAINRDFSGLYGENFEWLRKAVAVPRRGVA